MIIPKIDIHAHIVFQREYPGMGDGRFYPPTIEEIRKMYDAVGVEKGVQLPLVSPEHHHDLLTNRDARLLVEKHPDTVGWWFCNVDPRWLKNTADADLSIVMEYYKSLGAKGIGELTANLYIDDPMMQNLFYHAEKCGLPVLFHIGKAGGDDYGIVDDFGLPRLEETLKRFPNLIFIGHSKNGGRQSVGTVPRKSGEQIRKALLRRADGLWNCCASTLTCMPIFQRLRVRTQ